jgi:hypothetical protein
MVSRFLFGVDLRHRSLPDPTIRQRGLRAHFMLALAA